jgi:chromate transporter
MDSDEFTDIVAIAESTPGPIAINASTYVGYKAAKVLGAIVSTVAVCLPSLIIIFTISLFFDEFLQLKYVSYAFEGIRVCVCLLILFAGIKMLKKLKRNLFNIILLSISFVAVLLLGFFAIDISTVYFVLAGGAVGIIAYLIGLGVSRARQKEKAKPDTPDAEKTTEENKEEEL